MKVGIIIFFVLAALIAGLGALTYMNRAPNTQSELVKSVEISRHPVETLVVRPSTLVEKLDRTGVLKANRDVVVSAEVQGKIDRIFKELGDRCKKDEVLLRLDQEGYKIARAQAQAALKLSQVGLDQARRSMDRVEKLRKSAVATAQEFDAAETGVQTSAANVEQAKAGLRLAERNLRETSVRCPFSGFVAQRMVDVGDSVGLGVALARLVNIDQLRLTVNVSAALLARLNVGLKVVLEDPSLPGIQVQGEVARLGVAADPQTRTFPIEIVTADPEHRLRPGQVVQASCELARHEGVLAVPVDTVSTIDGKPSVLLVVEGKTATAPVRLGAKIDDQVIVLSGLKSGDEVILFGGDGLKEGSPVEVVGSTDASKQAIENTESTDNDRNPSADAKTAPEP